MTYRQRITAQTKAHRESIAAAAAKAAYDGSEQATIDRLAYDLAYAVENYGENENCAWNMDTQSRCFATFASKHYGVDNDFETFNAFCDQLITAYRLQIA
jgi:hypothetical protein